MDPRAAATPLRIHIRPCIEDGRSIRVLSVVDAYTRECLALEADPRFASRRVTRVLPRTRMTHPSSSYFMSLFPHYRSV